MIRPGYLVALLLALAGCGEDEDGDPLGLRWTLFRQALVPPAERWLATTVPYWQGEVIARDRESDERRGEGYPEMTGY